MPDQHDDRHRSGQRRGDNLEGLRDLGRQSSPSRRERRRAARDEARADAARRDRARPGRHAIGATPDADRAAGGGALGGGSLGSGALGVGALGGGAAGLSGGEALPGDGRRSRRGLRRRWPRRMLIGVNVLVALCLIAGVGAYGYVEHQLGNVTKVKVGALTSSSSGPFTVLIIGSDSRSIAGEGDQYGSAAQTPGQRSDTVMLARIVPKTRSMTILSIPRDLWVNIPGMGQSRINSAFNNGPALLITTIQDDLGIPINHFVEINFETFKNITDAVGGVKVWFPTPAKDIYSGLEIPKAGCVTLTGNEALAFARSRHYESYEDGQWEFQGLSDLARIQRQQFYVKKMISKAETKLSNPLALNDVLTSVTKNLTVDSGFSTHLMIGLAEDFHTADVAGIPTETVPTYNETIDGAEVLGLQQPQAQQMISSFNSLGAPKTPAASTTATTAPGSHLAVEVANGSGVSGQAADAASGLTHLGYDTTVDQESPGYDFTQSDIEYAPDAATAAKQLQAQVGGSATLTESSALTPTPYSLELITGSDYTGIRGQAATTPTTSPTTAKPTTTTTPAASTKVTDYPLPGPDPTEAQLASC